MGYGKIQLKRNRIIAVDIDDTLLVDGKLDLVALNWCVDQKEDGMELILWSARGRVYAERFAEKYDIADMFYAIIGKPGYVLDDDGWRWTQYTRTIDPAGI